MTDADGTGERLFDGARRVVVKLGSSLVAHEGGAPNAALLDAVARDAEDLAKRGIQTIVVTSGAVALGRAAIGVGAGLDQKQAAAAVGQSRLMAAWGEAFSAFGRPVGQLLLTLADMEDRGRYLNARAALDALLEANAVPIANENDTVATAEIRYGDNDRLAAHVAQLAGAGLLVLLSDVDGLFDGDPTDPQAKLIGAVGAVTPQIEALARGANTERGVGTGGMRSKLEAARIASRAGCRTVIARGVSQHPLLRLTDGAPCTLFAADGEPGPARARWIAGRLKPVGSLTIDAGAAEAVRSGGSLLAAGVVAVEGGFSRGDAVTIRDEAGQTVAVGLVAYDAADAARIRGLRSEAIEGVLGYRRRPALVHRDDMALADDDGASNG